MNLSLENQVVLITGTAGFIGSWLAEHLLKTIKGIQVAGIDNMNSYYDVTLKEKRLLRLKKYENFHFVKGDIAHKETVMEVFNRFKPAAVLISVLQTVWQRGRSCSFLTMEICIGILHT